MTLFYFEATSSTLVCRRPRFGQNLSYGMLKWLAGVNFPVKEMARNERLEGELVGNCKPIGDIYRRRITIS